MQTLDLIIIFGYWNGVAVFGDWFESKQETTRNF